MSNPPIALVAGAPEDAPSEQSARKIFEKIDPNDDFGLMSVEGVAEALCKDVQTIRNWVARREIPFIRLGNRTVFRRDSVREWLNNQEVKPHGCLKTKKKN